MTTRRSAIKKTGTGTQQSRRSTRKGNSRGVQVVGTTVSFTAPATISDSGSGFTAAAGFAVGQRVTVTGSAKNSRQWVITARANGALTVTPAQVTTEAAGPNVTVREGH